MEIREIDDYVDIIQEKFPELTKKDVSKILKFGLRSFYLHNLYGADVLLKSRYIVAYCGNFFKSKLRFVKYHNLKKRLKIRILHKRNKIPFDGYYYFGYTENEYQKLLKNNDVTENWNSSKKKWTIHNVYLYKVLDELLTLEYDHYFSIYYGIDVGYKIFRDEFESRQIKYLYRRNKNGNLEQIKYKNGKRRSNK